MQEACCRMKYSKADNVDMKRPLTEPGPVLAYGREPSEIVFACPCGGREVYITSPPHTIEFDDAGILVSLGGSVGSRPLNGPHEFRMVHGTTLHDLPKNWCHFWIKNGGIEMCSDSKCPGSRL